MAGGYPTQMPKARRRWYRNVRDMDIDIDIGDKIKSCQVGVGDIFPIPISTRLVRVNLVNHFRIKVYCELYRSLIQKRLTKLTKLPLSASARALSE